MGSASSSEEEETVIHDTERNIVIEVESGLYAGYPRRWMGTVIATIHVRPSSTVASFLNTIQSIPQSRRGYLPVTLHTIHTQDFEPTKQDLQRTVKEMGLRSGKLRLFNGKTD